MKWKSLLSRREFLANSSLSVAAIASVETGSENSVIPAPDYSIPESGFHGKLENKRDWSSDPRSGKVVFLSHCMLNLNARMIDCADFPSMFEPLVDYLQKNQVGLIQMTCPELYCLGLGRFDVRIGLESRAGRERLERLLDDLIFTIREYLFQDFEVVGILGKEGSPSCGVTRTWLDERQQDGQ
ncbi:MAG: hypothetical protein V1794_11770 [Candidatus Glassbacteria bacterium]